MLFVCVWQKERKGFVCMSVTCVALYSQGQIHVYIRLNVSAYVSTCSSFMETVKRLTKSMDCLGKSINSGV